MKLLTAPEDLSFVWQGSNRIVFLAGSIEMGKAIEWQDVVIEALSEAPITVLNPRRKDWDPSWEQSLNSPNFVQQVRWEQDGIELSDHVFFFIDPATMSPITLLEFGQVYAANIPFTLVCPKGFWRRGNLEVMCDVIGRDIHETLEDGIKALKTALQIS